MNIRGRERKRGERKGEREIAPLLFLEGKIVL